MGNPFSKDGVITKAVETLPGGGHIAVPFHFAAESTEHGLKAQRHGFLGPLSHFIELATNNPGSGSRELSTACDEFNFEPARRNEIVNAAERGNKQQAGDLIVEEGRRKLVENSGCLSAESGGRRILKSERGAYLRAYYNEMKVDLAPEALAWEHWYVEDHGGKVVFKAIHSPAKFLRAHSNGRVDLTMAHPHDCEAEYWTPLKNDDGSWSFLSIHGRWLAGLENGVVKCQQRWRSSGRFWLETW